GKDLLAQDETTLLAMRGKDMAMVLQEPLSALNPVMTVGDQIAEVMRVHHAYPGEARMRRVLELLDFVGLPDPATLVHSYPFRLSGGQRQRVVIAMALALEPALLIADEPTTALDVTIQAQILRLLMDLQKEFGIALLLITHDLGVVARMAHKVAVMYAGEIVESGTSAEVFNAPKHPYTLGL
ncbi:ABC transporter ATP-binding protein, partial [Acinetobacter baumannii]